MHGNLLAACVRRVPANWSTLVSELVAVVFGLEVAIRMGFNHLHLEGGNVTVFKALTNVSPGCSSFHILLDCFSALRSYFIGFRSCIVRRSGNTTAHMVARWNLSFVGDTIYMLPSLKVLYLWLLLISININKCFSKKKNTPQFRISVIYPVNCGFCMVLFN